MNQRRSRTRLHQCPPTVPAQKTPKRPREQFKKAKLSKNTSTIANTDVNRSMREQSHSANTENIVNHDVDKVDNLQQEFNGGVS